jgi:hypothetical protein
MKNTDESESKPVDERFVQAHNAFVAGIQATDYGPDTVVDHGDSPRERAFMKEVNEASPEEKRKMLLK